MADESPILPAANAMQSRRKADWKKSLRNGIWLAVAVLVLGLSGWTILERQLLRSRVEEFAKRGALVTVRLTTPDWLESIGNSTNTLPQVRQIGSRTCDVMLRKPADESLIGKLSGLPAIQKLTADRGGITDDSVKLIAARKRLQQVSLNGSPITDDGVRHLLSLPELAVISLEGTEVTDKSVDALSRLESMAEIRVGGPNIQGVRSTMQKFSPPKNGTAYLDGESLVVTGSFMVNDATKKISMVYLKSGPLGSGGIVDLAFAPPKKNADGTMSYRFQTTVREWTFGTEAYEINVYADVSTYPRIVYRLTHATIQVLRQPPIYTKQQSTGK